MRSVILVLAIGLLLAGTAPGSPILNQMDDFQGGTVQGWSSGAPNPNPPVNVATGGPVGAGDKYLQVSATGLLGAGGKLLAFNTAQWAGNYTAAGVTAIRMDLINLSNVGLTMRLAMNGAGGRFSSTTGDLITAGSGWHTVTFSVTSGSLSSVGGTDANATLGSLTELRIVEAPSPSYNGAAISASFGVDNITAVAEPATLTVMALGGLALTRRRCLRA